MLEEREAFLRAIFDSPADDTPKLVFADWLEERGEEGAAVALRMHSAMRAAVESERLRLYGELQAHIRSLGESAGIVQGLLTGGTGLPIEVGVDDLLDERAFRELSATRWPWWFNADELRVNRGRITNSQPLDTIFSVPATRRVRSLDLSGVPEPIPGIITDTGGGVLSVAQDYREHPVITSAGVVALAKHRGTNRLFELDLTNNGLDNDAARALARSPYFASLRSLRLYEGNRLRGQVWQQVVARFGEHVLGEE